MLLLLNALGSGICWPLTVPFGNLVFIFDASGSMGVHILGKMTIDQILRIKVYSASCPCSPQITSGTF
jgi:hypothetical protein